MGGALHIAAKDDAPYLNETVFSRSRDELLARTGSRYAPASPGDGLGIIENAPSPCVFIGKPCDAAAVQGARRLRPQLDEKIGLVVSFFCAGVPSTKGTLELLRKQGITDFSTVRKLRYRGNGWPGSWTVEYENGSGEIQEVSLTYADSWGFLEKFRQWRCYICPDHTGEFADIAVGDPWYRKIKPGEAGSSLIVARTQLGYETIMAAREAGYLVLNLEVISLLPSSQPNLLKTRSMLWGRLATLRIMGAAVPDYPGFSLLGSWLKELSLLGKVRSISGTVNRVFRRRLLKKAQVKEWTS
jgi:coenzyme F420 hydrogenase subunit beta